MRAYAIVSIVLWLTACPADEDPEEPGPASTASGDTGSAAPKPATEEKPPSK